MMNCLISRFFSIFLCLVWVVTANRAFRNFRPIRSKDSQITIESLEQKLQEEKFPIFEFKYELEQLLQKADQPILSYENLLQRYLYGLRSHYYEEFCRRFDQHKTLPLNPLNTPQAIRSKMMKECEVAMKRSIPASMNETSFYEDYLIELKYDIDQYIDFHADADDDKLFSEETILPPQKGLRGLIAKVLTKQRLKWILGQALLLGINIVQTEIYRWWSRREIDKKLAETPEFPLL